MYGGKSAHNIEYLLLQRRTRDLLMMLRFVCRYAHVCVMETKVELSCAMTGDMLETESLWDCIDTGTKVYSNTNQRACTQTPV